MPRFTTFLTLPRFVALLLSAGFAVSAQAQLVSDESVPANLPAQELTPQVMYELLLSEIAGSRGYLDVATQGYLDLARRTRDPRLAKRAAEVALVARKGPEALEATRLWSELDPGSEPALQTLSGLMAGGLGSLPEAEPVIAKQLALHAAKPESSLLALGSLFTRYTDKAAVSAAVKRLTQPYLKWPEAYFARAIADLGAEQADECLADLNRALELRPGWDQAAMIKAQVLHQAGRTKDSLSFLKSYLMAYPKAHELRNTYARLLAFDKQLPASLAEFEILAAADSAKLDYVSGYALLLAQTGNKLKAEEQFRRAVTLERAGSGQAAMQLAQFLESENRNAEAIEAYRAVVGQLRVQAQSRAAMLQARGGDLAGAQAALQAERGSEPKLANEYLLTEAQLLREFGKPDEAFKLLAGALKQQPDQPDLLYDYALVAEKLGKTEEMETSLRRVIKLKPGEAQAYNALGYSLADRNVRLDEAVTLISKALEISPDDGFILDSMGWVLFRKGDLIKAEENLRRAYTVRTDPEIAAHLGEVLWMRGQQDEARKVWDEARKAHPDNAELVRTVQRLAP